jgi:SWI/SNF-related matrix-associated actin-dependent regulator 1 of chromatin subfamily A
MPVYVEKGPSNRIPIDRSSLYVYTLDYDPIFTEKIKIFPLRYYHSNIKKWELPMSSLSMVFKNFRNVVVKGDLREANKLRFDSIEKYIEYLNSLIPLVPFDFKTQPDPHQIEWFNEMIHRNRVILGDPMGLGKTKQYLDVAEYRRKNNGYMKTLFICKSKHKDNMARQIEIHTNSNYLIVEEGGEAGLQILRDYYYDDDIYYLIISYEMAAKFSKQLKIIGSKIGIDGVIMDEFNKIKNWGTRGRERKDGKAHITLQTTNLIETLNPEYLVLGSGTPMTKDPTDLYAPLRLVGIENRDYYQFKDKYCIVDSFGRVRGTQNEQELHDRLNSVMIRRPKELLRLPEKRSSYIPVRMTPQQADLYQFAKKRIKEELKGTKAYTKSDLALLTRLRQITTNPRLVNADIDGIKELYLDEYLEDVFNGGEKALVYSIYTEETRRLKAKYRHLNPAYVDGTMSSREAQAEVDRLQNDPNTRLLIGSLQATKESYTLTEANYGLFLDLSWTYTDNEQAEDRMHRRGQTGIVNIIVPYCIGTIDERVLDILAEDSTAIQEIVDGGSVSFRKEVVEYLIA